MFNHTREDGPFDPCPICLPLMSKDELIAYIESKKDELQKYETPLEASRAIAKLLDVNDIVCTDEEEAQCFLDAVNELTFLHEHQKNL